jgi:hypothetical protein
MQRVIGVVDENVFALMMGSMRVLRSAEPGRYFGTWAAIPTAWPLPTPACSPWKTTRCFHWRDYADDNRLKVMRLTAEEFIRRFLLHVLPSASSEFAITGSWPVATSPPSWPVAENSWA